MMTTFLTWLRRGAEALAAALMAALFLTFVVQVVVRYGARLGLDTVLPVLDPARYGWTLELCLALWVWLVFWGGAFVVQSRDHVTFDMISSQAGPRTRRVFAALGGIAIGTALLASIEPTWAKFAILRLKKTATLADLFGDWIRMRHVYAIYMVFLAAVGVRMIWQAVQAVRGSGHER